MCNHYRNDIRKAGLERAIYGFDEISDLPRDIYPDQLAPVIRLGSNGEWVGNLVRWGFPPPPNVGTRPVTNVRNLDSTYWRPWLQPKSRCLVPFTQFAEWHAMSKREAWFALTDENQQGMFAGIWRSWQGVRGPKSRPVEGEHIVFAFLTCQPNEIVAPIHPKAMPVILANADQQEAWLHAPASAVPALAGPLALDQLVLLDAARARS